MIGEMLTQPPEEAGFYFLYARVWGDDVPKFYAGYVRKIANGFAYIFNGNFVFPSDIEGPAKWWKIETPEVPSE